jgi:arsenate reductase (thioredoxin)
MAHGYLQHFANGKATIYSAGIETHGVNPKAILVMQEDGIDIAHHTSNNVNEYVAIDFDFIITVCDNANENCPYFPSKAKKYHHNFSDPSKIKGSETEVWSAFQATRNEIKTYCQQFIQQQL